MKKNKLILSFCSLAALVVSCPVIATSCSTTSDNNLNKQPHNGSSKAGINHSYAPRVADSNNSLEVRLINLPETILSGDTISVTPSLIRNNFTTSIGVRFEIDENGTDKCLHASIDDNYQVTLRPSAEATNRINTITFKVSYGDEGLDKTAYASCEIDNVISIGNQMTFRGETYKLAEDINPNVFVTSYYGDDYVTERIPLADGSSLLIDGYVNSWDDISSLHLETCNPYVTNIEPFFLAYCDELVDLDLSGLNNITNIKYGFLYECVSLSSLNLYSMTSISEIGGAFLYGCSSLLDLTVPNKNPQTFATASSEFMDGVNNNLLIFCEDLLPQYQESKTWDQWANKMDGADCYSISELNWTSPFVTSPTDRIPAYDTLSVDLQLQGSHLSSSDFQWKVETNSSTCLNASVKGSKLTITPTWEAIGKDNRITIDAYSPSNHRLLSSLSCHINNVTYNNFMVADGQQYILANDIDPNIFSSVNPGVIVKLIDGSWKHFYKIDIESLGLFSCNQSTVTLWDNFLFGCTNLKAVDLSGLESIKLINDNFLAGCFGVERIGLPNSLETIGDYFMNSCAEFNSDLTIPNSVRRIGNYFMIQCKEFNSNLHLPEILESIGSDFMFGCYEFNNGLSFPKSLKSIGDDFLCNCTAFNNDILLEHTKITEIPNCFLGYCHSFNSILTFPKSTKSIGNNCMHENLEYNKTFVFPESLESIGEEFMSWSKAFDQEIVIPASVKSVGKKFMYAYKGWHKAKLINNSSVDDDDIPLVSWEQFIAQMTITLVCYILIFIALAIVITYFFPAIIPGVEGEQAAVIVQQIEYTTSTAASSVASPAVSFISV